MLMIGGIQASGHRATRIAMSTGELPSGRPRAREMSRVSRLTPYHQNASRMPSVSRFSSHRGTPLRIVAPASPTWITEAPVTCMLAILAGTIRHGTVGVLVHEAERRSSGGAGARRRAGKLPKHGAQQAARPPGLRALRELR